MNTCIQKLIQKLRAEFEYQTGDKLTNFADPKFGSWLQENDPIEKNADGARYVTLDKKNFAKALMDAYVGSINQVSKLLDKRDPEKTYTKLEVLDLISDAFGIAKTEGETRIRQINQRKYSLNDQIKINQNIIDR